MLPRDVSIQIRSMDCEALLTWSGFDGDDGFEAFSIEVRGGTDEPKRFDFGGCVVWSLRRTTRLLARDELRASGGFKYPDVRTYEWEWIGSDLKLVVTYEGTRLHEEFLFQEPQIAVDRLFIDTYDGRLS
ncbi:hypothetical protein DB347_10635 [Opitutaceae bacterium EW11]|nr:hypothetical protein DB347_10635 [Opitutaceae bacterium EW11]